MNCKICASNNLNKLQKDEFSIYYHCNNCDVIFKDSKYYIDEQLEKSRYLSHNNYYKDQKYKDYLNNLIKDLGLTGAKDSEKVLDFGCGYQPVLGELLRGIGYNIKNYDYYFNKNEQVFDEQYDLIISVEVFEHLDKPIETFQLLKNCLLEEGKLYIVTRFHNFENDEFLDWWYIKDDTHIIFYSERTMQFIAELLNFSEVKCFDDRYSIFTR